MSFQNPCASMPMATTFESQSNSQAFSTHTHNLNAFKNQIEQEPQILPRPQHHQTPQNFSAPLIDGLNETLFEGCSLNEDIVGTDEIEDLVVMVHELPAQKENCLRFGVLSTPIQDETFRSFEFIEFGTNDHVRVYLRQRVQNNREYALRFRHLNIPHQGGNNGYFRHDLVFIAHFTDDVDTKPFTNDDAFPSQDEGRGPLTWVLTTESDEET